MVKKSVSSSPGSSSMVLWPEQSEGKTIEHNIIHTLGLLLSLPWFIWLKSAEPFVLLTGEKLHTTCSSLSDFNRQHSIIPLIISRFSSSASHKGAKVLLKMTLTFHAAVFILMFADFLTFYTVAIKYERQWTSEHHLSKFDFPVKCGFCKKLLWPVAHFFHFAYSKPTQKWWQNEKSGQL